MSVDSSAALALEVSDLELAYRVRGVDRPVLRGVSFSIERGRSYGLVGESGCGKSTVALGIVRYLPRNGRISGGAVSVAGRDVLALGAGGLREYHARTVSMVYQNPGSALNPSLRVGAQVAEAFTVLGVGRGDAGERARAALARVQIADPSSVMSRYPHQLSGGMQQRVVIAMALAKDPALLILDEPTTGLDATVEAEVLDLVSQLQAELDTAVLFISHNLGVISKMCDRGRRALRGAARRGRAGRHGASQPAPPVHGRPAALHPARRRAQGPRAARHDPRLPAAARRRAPGLRLRRPLCARRRPAATRRSRRSSPSSGATRAAAGITTARPRCPARRPPISSFRASTAASRRSSRSEELVEGLHAARARRPRAHRGQRRHLAGRDSRARRRVGQRQDDARAHAARDRGRKRGHGDARRANRSRRRYQKRSRDDLRVAPDRLPEPGLGAQPAALRPAHPPALDEEARRDRRRTLPTRGCAISSHASASRSGR